MDYGKAPIVNVENDVSEKVLVTVCVQTYNHEKFISKCLESILSQKTSFDFEILIGEDESTDRTREICLEFAEKYPSKIRLFLHSRENVIRINNKPTGRFNQLYNYYSANGKYIALCEGDDWWTDNSKLQRQVDQLENNPDYYGSFHGFEVKHINSGRKKTFEYPELSKINLEFYLTNNTYIATCSLLFRREILEELVETIPKLFAADFYTKYLILTYGNLGYINSVMSRYNKGTAGSWSLSQLTKQRIEQEFLDNLIGLMKIYSRCKSLDIDSEVFTCKVNEQYNRYKTRKASLLPFWYSVYSIFKNAIIDIFNLLKFKYKNIFLKEP